MNLLISLIFMPITVYVMLQIRGSILNRYLKKAFEGGLLLLLLFVVIKIMHWPGANLLLLMASAILLLSKGASMASQRPTIYDYLMLAWLLIYVFTVVVRILHLLDLGTAGDFLITAAEIILLVALLSKNFISR